MAEPFTKDQQELWDACGPVVPSGDQTQEQAENWAVLTFQGACEFDGWPVPSEATIRAAIAAQPSKAPTDPGTRWPAEHGEILCTYPGGTLMVNGEPLDFTKKSWPEDLTTDDGVDP